MAILTDDSLVNLYPTVPTGSYCAAISNIRCTGTDAAGSVMWAMRNPLASTKTVCIRRITGMLSFDGTAAPATGVGFEFGRFASGDPSTGSTIARIKKRSSYAVSQILDANAQQKVTALTMTSVVKDAAFFAIKIPISVTSGNCPFDLRFVTAGLVYEPFELAAGEGLYIQTLVAAVIGTSLNGCVEWDER
jgi:hypothetical protein